METIEERAQKVSCEIFPKDNDDRIVCKHSYILGANQQRDIDIDRAVEWLHSYCKIDDNLYSIDLDEFRRAIKGE